MFMRTLTAATLALGLAAPIVIISSPVFAAEPSVISEPIKVVYHVNEGVQQASRAIGNIRNHLNAAPGTKIVVVTHGSGIDFLLDGAENAAGAPFAPSISELKSLGVDFRVCNNTLVSRKIDPKSVVSEASIVPSGVAAVAKLQAREGFVYLKP
ncbi:MAG: DsrE family protein [Halothiobacillaceae bacterium]|nr:DsrE family protein [Halothiobacillaceae bacterium]